eukprot:7185769-Alexandrium_andersonii.AAC.1
MSASLVGSEMCIRDSYFGCVTRGRMGAAFCHPSWAGTSRPGPLHKREPVSYTHLTLPTICSV